MFTRETYSNFSDLPLTMNVNDVMKALNIGRETAYKLLRSKDFPSFKLGGKYLVNKESLFEWQKALQK
jgi:excisionase family DNA binding protein